MEQKIKVFHVLTDKNIGGAGRWLLYYLKYHNRNKFEISVVYLKTACSVMRYGNWMCP